MGLEVPRHAPDGYECPFCAYVAGGENDLVRQDHVVERTEGTVTFVSPKWWPHNAGALLVVPVRHVENLYEFPDDLAEPMFAAMRRAASALKVAYECDGTSTRQHNEPAGNQDVWHFHIHVFPRYPGDGLYGAKPSWAPIDEMSERAVLLRAAYATL